MRYVCMHYVMTDIEFTTNNFTFDKGKSDGIWIPNGVFFRMNLLISSY